MKTSFQGRISFNKNIVDENCKEAAVNVFIKCKEKGLFTDSASDGTSFIANTFDENDHVIGKFFLANMGINVKAVKEMSFQAISDWLSLFGIKLENPNIRPINVKRN